MFFSWKYLVNITNAFFQVCLKRYLADKHQNVSDIKSSCQVAETLVASKRQVEVARLFRTAYYVAKSCLPFTKYEEICELQRMNGLSLGLNYMSNNACKRFVSSIAADLKSQLALKFNASRFVSILSDGSTDKGMFLSSLVIGFLAYKNLFCIKKLFVIG